MSLMAVFLLRLVLYLVVPLCSYGARGAGPAIPPNSWLVFDVELVDVN